MCAATCQGWQGLPSSAGGPSGPSWGLGVWASRTFFTRNHVTYFFCRSLCFSVSTLQETLHISASLHSRAWFLSLLQAAAESLQVLEGLSCKECRTRRLQVRSPSRPSPSGTRHTGPDAGPGVSGPPGQAFRSFTLWTTPSKRPPRRPTAMRRSVASLWRPCLEFYQ